MDVDAYKEKIWNDCKVAKEDAFSAYLVQKTELERTKFAVNKQLMINNKLETDMNMFHEKFNANLTKMLNRFADSNHYVEDKLRRLNQKVDHRLVKFADVVIKEC